VVEALVAAGLSALLYHLGVGLPLFLIPLQAVRVRRGPRAFATAAAAALAAIAGVRLALTAGRPAGGTAPFLIVELFVVCTLVGGLAWVQASQPRLPEGRVVRLLVAAAAVGLAAIPLARYLAANEAFGQTLRGLFDLLAEGLNRAFGTGGAVVRGEELAALTREAFLRSFLLDYLLLLTFGWWVGSRVGARLAGRPAGVARLEAFRMPEGLIWPLIAGLTLVVLSLFVRTGALEFAGWNVLLAMLFFYGLTGLGILRSLLVRFGLPRAWRTAIAVVLAILVLTPGVNVALAVLIPGLGVSETWIRYRNMERSEV